MNYLGVTGVIATVIEIISIVPYYIDIIRGKTKPERVSFWIFLLLNSITFAAQIADGGSWATLLIGVSVLTTLGIALLSIKHGYGSIRKRDYVSVGVAFLGLVAWAITSVALFAVIMVVLVDLSAFWLILVKSWESPHSETLAAWVGGAVATTLAAVSVGSYRPVQITYALYSAIGNWALVALLIYRRRKVKL